MFRASRVEDAGRSLKSPNAQVHTLVHNRTWYPTLLWMLPVGIVAIDQILKAIIVMWLGPDAGTHRWEFAGAFLALTYLENTGAAFGMLPDHTELLAALSIIIVAACGFLMWRESKVHPLTACGIAFVVGGAVGNMIDRIRLGYVVDFIAVGIWPTFNIADSAITIGIVLLVWSVIRDERAVRKEQREYE